MNALTIVLAVLLLASCAGIDPHAHHDHLGTDTTDSLYLPG